ncbi:MAG: hypothetical protein AAFQ14_09355 [Cyanobacteria bacterium J06621_12]
MGNKNHNLPNRLVQGGQKRSVDAKPPATVGAKGKIDTSINIRWTPRKKVIAATVLGVPFLLSTVSAFKSGNALVGIILVGLAVFFGLMYLALRYIENNEF